MKYICELCGTVYDEDKGNPAHGIAEGTPFEKLPKHYDCPCCGSEKEAYTPISEQTATIKRTAEQYVKYSSARQESDR